MRQFDALKGHQMSLDQTYFSVLARARARARARNDSKKGVVPDFSG
jgi:hypothetical protein